MTVGVQSLYTPLAHHWLFFATDWGEEAPVDGFGHYQILPLPRYPRHQERPVAAGLECFVSLPVHGFLRVIEHMHQDVIILVADDDAGHARLVEKNLRRAGLHNRILRFEDGQQILDFLFHAQKGQDAAHPVPYLLLLDIRMPKIDGIEVLRQVKEDAQLRKMPVIMLTTTDDPREVERCHLIGCSSYIVKPVDYEKFSEVIRNLGLFISLVKVPGSQLKVD